MSVLGFAEHAPAYGSSIAEATCGCARRVEGSLRGAYAISVPDSAISVADSAYDKAGEQYWACAMPVPGSA
eukprot:1784044-Rhodomonas_salina.1